MKEMYKFGFTRKSLYALVLAGLALAGTAMAQDGEAASEAKIESKIAAFTITLDENGNERRERATTVSPGGVIEYQLSYRNISGQPLSDFVILGDVPPATYYLSAERLDMPEAVFEVSVADIGWGAPPLIRYVRDEAGIMRPVKVPEAEFEALRWRLAEPIIPGEEVSATYRIKVEN